LLERDALAKSGLLAQGRASVCRTIASILTRRHRSAHRRQIQHQQQGFEVVVGVGGLAAGVGGDVLVVSGESRAAD
jgi:hypothetical protein